MPPGLARGVPAPQPAFGLRLALGLLGILLAAITAGLNSRVSGLALADVRGALGLGVDEASWLNTVYAAGELAVMPFAGWFAITFSLRRFTLAMLVAIIALAALIPQVHELRLLLALRGMQGVFSGTLIPLLMMAALRFLPPPIRLHGLALYALTATFAPNVALWLASQWVDQLADWRWVYWQVMPFGVLAAALVAYGIPKMPLALPRLRQANWLGLALGMPGLALMALVLDQGVRLDWLHSPLIQAALWAGGLLSLLFVLSEWRHPAPFIKLQLLERRNLGLGFSIFVCLLLCMSVSVALPANTLAHLQGFRLAQTQSLGLIIALPQLLLGPAVAVLLYQRWVDARYLFALGALCIAAACGLAANISSEWQVQQLLAAQVLQALGQPMAVIALLFLGTSVVQPMEGPYVSGIINTLRALGTLVGSSLVGELLHRRGQFHAEMLLDQAGRWLSHMPQQLPAHLGSLSASVAEQASVLATADVYRVFGLLALLLVPLALCLQHIAAPVLTPPLPSSPGAAVPAPTH
jgi:DHA2 family multidrug resistance protein